MLCRMRQLYRGIRRGHGGLGTRSQSRIDKFCELPRENDIDNHDDEHSHYDQPHQRVIAVHHTRQHARTDDQQSKSAQRQKHHDDSDEDGWLRQINLDNLGRGSKRGQVRTTAVAVFEAGALGAAGWTEHRGK